MDPPGAGVAQVAERFVGHLAGADHQHVLVVEPLEHAAGEVGDRHAGDAHAVLVQVGFVVHAAGGAQGRLKQLVHHRAGGAESAARW